MCVPGAIYAARFTGPPQAAKPRLTQAALLREFGGGARYEGTRPGSPQLIFQVLPLAPPQEDAPALLRTLLDGLIWRSHRTDNSERRVNYYLKNLVVKARGGARARGVQEPSEPARHFVRFVCARVRSLSVWEATGQTYAWCGLGEGVVAQGLRALPWGLRRSQGRGGRHSPCTRCTADGGPRTARLSPAVGRHVPPGGCGFA